MSTYSQSEVARIVESVLPDILRSGDPQATLIKRATELNLPPAVLEKAGQVYNTAKTLNHLEGVDELEKRGSTFETLDVPGMVEVYSGYEPKNKSIKVVQTNDLWSAAAFDKSASVLDSEYRLPKSFNPILHDSVDPLEKMASASTTNSFGGEAQGEKIRKRAAAAAAERDLETCRTLINTVEANFMRKAADIANQYLGLDVYAPDMATLEAETSKVSGKPDLVKQAFDAIAGFVARHPASLAHVKRASEDTQVASLVWETGYHSLVNEALDHLGILNAAREEYSELEKTAAEFKSNTFTSDSPFGLTSGGKRNKAKGGGGTTTKTKEDPNPKYKSDTTEKDKEDEAKAKADNAKAKADNAFGLKLEAFEAERSQAELAKLIEDAQSEEVAESETNVGATVKSHIQKSWNSAPVKSIREEGSDAIISDMQRQIHERQSEIDNAALMARGEAALNTLLLTDPVISEYDEEEMRDIFFTILRENKDVATDINQLRGILRAAGSFDGVVDIETAKQLKTLRKLDREGSKGSKGNKGSDDDEDND